MNAFENSGDLPPPNPPSGVADAAKYRDIARVLQEKIDGLDQSDPNAKIQKRVLSIQRDGLCLKAEALDPTETVDTGSRSDVVYEVTDWDTLTFEPVDEHAMTDEEIAGWVDSELVEDPSLSIRLGFTEETSVEDMALAIILNRQDS